MEKIGKLEILIKGKKGKINLEPDNYDIKEIMNILQNTENLLFPNNKADRPIISYSIHQGSVKHIFKTSIQYIIGFNAIIGQVASENNIDFLDLSTAKAIEQFQENTLKNEYEYEITTSVSNSNKLIVNKETHYFRTDFVWVDAEFYFYGKITNMGGKEKANFHLATDNFGSLIIQTDKNFLSNMELNPLYKTFGIRAQGKQNSDTGEIDKSTLKFLELIDYNSNYEEDYLSKLINEASKSWSKIEDTSKWLLEIRGGYE